MLLLALTLSLLTLLSVPLVHELGHALAALLVGGREVRFAHKGGLCLVTRALLPEQALAHRVYYAGGPLANVLVAGALAFAARALASEPVLLLLGGGAALVHLAFALVNLLPLEGYDGRALFGGGMSGRISGRTRASSAPRGGPSAPA